MHVTWRAHTLPNTAVQAALVAQSAGCCGHAALLGRSCPLGTRRLMNRSLRREGPSRLTSSSSAVFKALFFEGREAALDARRVFLHMSLSDSHDTRWSQEGVSPVDARFAASPGIMSLQTPCD